MQKTKFKILVLIILTASVLTIDGYEFLHNHDAEKENHCISCLLSASLIADNSEIAVIIGLKVLPEFIIKLHEYQVQPEFILSYVSDRAPPLS